MKNRHDHKVAEHRKNEFYMGHINAKISKATIRDTSQKGRTAREVLGERVIRKGVRKGFTCLYDVT